MSMVRSFGALVPVPFSVVFVEVIVGASLWERKRRRQRFQAPQTEKLLRPAGYSLSLKLDEISDLVVYKILAGFALCAVAGASFDRVPRISDAGSIITLLIGFVCSAGGGYAAILVIRDLKRGQNLRLGMRGEQAVAEALQEVADCGYRAFHDFPGGDNWNIDHVVVGAPGVFLIETKARNRVQPRRGQEQPPHVVRVYGRTLRFPSGNDTKAVPQAERNAQWLAEYLAKMTGETVVVAAVVVLSGWFVEIKEPTSGTVQVMNTKYLTGFLRGQTAKLPDRQVRRIIGVLDEKCRDVEF